MTAPSLAPDLHALGDDVLALLARTTEVDLAVESLRGAGYLLLAVPVGLGGLGGNLAQVCREQRRLAGWCPIAAVAVNDHLCRTGSAAQRWAVGEQSSPGVLEAALLGRLCGPDGDVRPDALAWQALTRAAIAAGVADRVGSAASLGG